MKWTFWVVLCKWTIAVLVILPLLGFQSTSVPTTTATTPNEVPDLSHRINAFTLRLLHQLAEETTIRDNMLVSGLSLYQGMGMSYVGSGGNTRLELAKVFNFPEDQAIWLKDLAKMRKELQTTSTSNRVELRLASSFWLDQTYASFKKDYLATLEDPFGSCLYETSFREREKASGRINQWVAQQTNNRIIEVVKPEDLLSRSIALPLTDIINEPALVLINAEYFKADWAFAFDKQATTSLPFHLTPKLSVDVSMMHQKSILPYAEDEQFQFVELPYMGKEFSMYVLLPKSQLSIGEMVQLAAIDRIIDLKSKSYRELYTVDLTLPKFNLRNRIPLDSVLKSMGVVDAFDSSKADFDRMIIKKAEAYRIYISQAYHDGWIVVDEEGTEATAVTTTVNFSIGCSTNIHPHVVKVEVNRPFLYFIVHNSTRSMVFAGWVTKPIHAKN